MRIPECEILMPTMAVKNHMRTGEFFKIISAIETSAEQGSWTWQRYQNWIESKKTWYHATPEDQPDTESTEAGSIVVAPPSARPASKPADPVEPKAALAPATPAAEASRRIEIEPVEGGLQEVIKRLEEP